MISHMHVDGAGSVCGLLVVIAGLLNALLLQSTADSSEQDGWPWSPL
jgi:hypothetical protein